MVDLTYFAFAVPFAIGVYLVIVSGVVYAYRSIVNKQLSEKNEQVTTSDLLSSYFGGHSFESCYRSVAGQAGARTLLITRLVSFIYLFAISFVLREIIDPVPPLSFTSWNIDLLWLYFFSATVASAVGLYYDDCLSTLPFYNDRSSKFWSDCIHRLGYALQILFAVSGSSSFFVTVVAFTFLDPYFDFWNVSFHFVTSISVLIELLMNNIRVRWEHIVLALTWSFLYLVFSWVIVRTGVLSHWPYFFLDTKSPTVFAWYTALLVLNSIFFVLFWLLNVLKEWVVSRAVSVDKFELLNSNFDVIDVTSEDEDIEDIDDGIPLRRLRTSSS